MGSISSFMGNSCPLAVPLLSHSKSTNLRGVTQDLQKSAETEGAVWKTDWWCSACDFVVHHGHNLSQRWRTKSQRDCHPQHMGDPCWPGWRAGWHNGDGSQSPRAGWQAWDLSRASQAQGKCKGDFAALPTMEGGQLLSGQWCVLYYTKWNLAHCLWEERVFSRMLQALNELHKEFLFFFFNLM